MKLARYKLGSPRKAGAGKERSSDDGGAGYGGTAKSAGCEEGSGGLMVTGTKARRVQEVGEGHARDRIVLEVGEVQSCLSLAE
jgi:hypothetical protein